MIQKRTKDNISGLIPHAHNYAAKGALALTFLGICPGRHHEGALKGVNTGLLYAGMGQCQPSLALAHCLPATAGSLGSPQCPPSSASSQALAAPQPAQNLRLLWIGTLQTGLTNSTAFIRGRFRLRLLAALRPAEYLTEESLLAPDLSHHEPCIVLWEGPSVEGGRGGTALACRK